MRSFDRPCVLARCSVSFFADVSYDFSTKKVRISELNGENHLRRNVKSDSEQYYKFTMSFVLALKSGDVQCVSTCQYDDGCAHIRHDDLYDFLRTECTDISNKIVLTVLGAEAPTTVNTIIQVLNKLMTDGVPVHRAEFVLQRCAIDTLDVVDKQCGKGMLVWLKAHVSVEQLLEKDATYGGDMYRVVLCCKSVETMFSDKIQLLAFHRYLCYCYGRANANKCHGSFLMCNTDGGFVRRCWWETAKDLITHTVAKRLLVGHRTDRLPNPPAHLDHH